jgi:ABC-2 type transport system permease protein
MIAKEWRDARWKLALGALAFLIIVVAAPRSYERILTSVEADIRSMEREVQRPVRLDPTAGPRDVENFERQMREDLERMREPGYPAKSAGWELQEVQRVGNYAILIPLAGLLGVTLVSAEVGQGSIYLLLSMPLGRRRMLLTKYAVCAACLLAVALVGAVGLIVSAFAHSYPSGALPFGPIFASAALIWLGSLFVLGVSLLASVIFRVVLPTILAAAATLYLVHVGPDVVRSVVEMIFWTNSDYMRPSREINAWYNAFETWRLSSYWGGAYPSYPFGGPGGPVTMTRSFLVCLVTAVPPLLLALWVFRRKAY